MRTFLAIPLLLLFIASCSPTSHVTTEQKSEKSPFQVILDSIYAEHPQSLGIMLHVESPSKGISWSGAAGRGMKGDRSPLDPGRPALIASNTKTYVSAAILRLTEKGVISLSRPIQGLISDRSMGQLKKDGYDPARICIAHLLSHTSGISDYTGFDTFFDLTKEKAPYRWTRDEQIALAMREGEPLGVPGEVFSYADTNYLLLTEILESQTGQSFPQAIRGVLEFEKHGLNSTWFESLEERPDGTMERVHQYSGSMDLHSHDIDVSFDLYGGGGLAATTEDLARFSQILFHGGFFEASETLELIYTKVKTGDPEPSGYYMGISEMEVNGYKAYGHGGFWGTAVNYLPQLDASVSVFILERDERKLRLDVLESVVAHLSE